MSNISALIDRSIELELNVSTLYSLFHKLFPQHGDFWWTLSIEEKNHAALLLTGKQHFGNFGMVPEKMLARKNKKLEMINYEIDFLIKKFSASPPSERAAFELAIQIEESAGELHFQKFMKDESDSPLEKIFHHLNHDDMDHASRIRRYMARFFESDTTVTRLPFLESAFKT